MGKYVSSDRCGKTEKKQVWIFLNSSLNAHGFRSSFFLHIHDKWFYRWLNRFNSLVAIFEMLWRVLENVSFFHLKIKWKQWPFSLSFAQNNQTKQQHSVRIYKVTARNDWWGEDVERERQRKEQLNFVEKHKNRERIKKEKHRERERETQAHRRTTVNDLKLIEICMCLCSFICVLAWETESKSDEKKETSTTNHMK